VSHYKLLFDIQFSSKIARSKMG